VRSWVTGREGQALAAIKQGKFGKANRDADQHTTPGLGKFGWLFALIGGIRPIG